MKNWWLVVVSAVVVLVVAASIGYGLSTTNDEVHARDHAICVRGNRLRSELRGFIMEVLPPQSPSRQKFLTEIQLMKCR